MRLSLLFMLGFVSSLHSQEKEQPVQSVKVNESCAIKCTQWYQMTKSLMGNNVSPKTLWKAYEACLTKCITLKSDKQKDKQ